MIRYIIIDGTHSKIKKQKKEQINNHPYRKTIRSVRSGRNNKQ